MSGGGPSALEFAYRYLNRCERTVAEVRRHLLSREIEPREAASAVEELIDLGALDDERFARLFVEDKRALEQWGSERVRRALEKRGIERELAEAALAEPAPANGPLAGSPADGEPPEDERERALALLRRRFPAPPRERRDRERALGVLVRKGYEYEYEYELALEALERHCAVHG